MVVIRLVRTGKKNNAIYKITVAHKYARLQGRFLEKIGFYNPTLKDKPLTVTMDRYDHWVKQGAQPSDRLKALIAQSKMEPSKLAALKAKSKAAKKKRASKAEGGDKAAEAAPAAAPQA